MEVTTLQAFLRVLYTVNNNPQYILAKSSSQVPTTVCCESTTQSATNEPTYARAPLMACLAAVCDSSPELLQDPTRDFSLYVLDPLEAQPLPTNLTHAPHNASSPRGIAVALGLMSWALESIDSVNVFVTGTIIPNASPALEVIFALRETKRMPKPMLHSRPSLGPISSAGPYQSLSPHYPPQAAGMDWSSTCHVQRDQQEQRTLTCSADFPELYIGPPRRVPGRPEGSTSSKSKAKSQSSTFSLCGANPSKGTDTRPECKQEVRKRSKQKTKPRLPRVPSTYSPFICEPLTRNTMTGAQEASTTSVPAVCQQFHPFSLNQARSQGDPQARLYPHLTHNPLLGLLSAIPSASSGNTTANTTPEQQAALITAIQQLLAVNPHLLQLVASNTEFSAGTREQTAENKPPHGGGNADDEHDDADSDIVMLDSSTVDTTAFRKPSHREHIASDIDTPPFTTSQKSAMPSTQDTIPSPLLASTPPSREEGTLASSQTSTPTISKTKTPTSNHLSSERTVSENITASRAPGIPVTPTPSRRRKRKLDEYTQDQTYSSIPTSPPSPSPSVTRASSSGRALPAKRVLSSPTRGTKLVSSPPVRLPSMLGSMRSMISSGSRLQVSSSGSSMRGYLAPPTTNKNKDPSTAHVSSPTKLKAVHPEITATSLNVTSDTASLKRGLNLNLNEVMEEHEAHRNAMVRKRPYSGCKSEVEVPESVSESGPSRSSKSVSTSRHAQSSPPRPLFRSDLLAPALPALTWQPSLVPGAGILNPSTTMPADTVPSASTSAAPTRNPLKNFVMPAWARTSTAMLPRLSEEALARQRAEREAKKAQVSLRRREAAKAKRKRLRGVERSSNESSDEEDATTNDSRSRTSHPSSNVAWNTLLPPPPPPSLPVFASDAVAPIPSSPPRTHQQPVSPVLPSTPPGKLVSPSVLHRTPNKSGSCSLFTPSGQEPGPLFTPSTPGITRSLTRATFTPHSPTVLHRSGARKSPQKTMLQTPWTPKCNSANHQTPRSLRSTGKNVSFASPSLAMRTPQTQSGMGRRAFLLPPPSPLACTSRTLSLQSQLRSKGSGSAAPLVTKDPGITKRVRSDKQNADLDKGSKEEGTLCEPNGGIFGTDTSITPAQGSPTRSTADDGQKTTKLPDIASDGDTSPAGVEYASSPLPPSSPLPASPFSSPAKHHDSNFNTPTTNNLVMPDSDIPLPSASDSEGPQGTVDKTWFSDDACPASWLTDSEASAWLTETETWLTDTEGGPLLTDSDGAWLSDSDAVFGDMSSLPPSSASNWLSDDADVDTDYEGRAMDGQDGTFDTAAFERAFAALVERGGRSVGGKDERGGNGATGTPDTRVLELRGLMRPLRGSNTLDGAGTATGDVPVDEDEAVHDFQELLDGLIGC